MEQEQQYPAREVVYLKGCLNPNSFKAKALALPGVTAVYEEDFDLEDPVTGETVSVCELIERRNPVEVRIIEQGDRLLVGVMMWDEPDMADPMALGRVLRTESRDDKYNACRAVGLDSYQDMDLDFVAVDDLKEQDVAAYIKKLSQDKECRLAIGKAMRSLTGVNNIRLLYLSLLQHSRNLDLDVISNDVFDEPYFSRLPQEVRDALWDLGSIDSDDGNHRRWKRALEVGRIGNPFACMVDVRGNHSEVYRSSGDWLEEAHGKSNFTVWIPDDGAQEAITARILKELGLDAEVIVEAAIPPKFVWATKCYAFRNGGITSEAYPTWLECLEALLLSSNRSQDAQELQSLVRKVVCEEADQELTEYSAWASGEVYAVETYVIDRNAPHDITDDVCFGGYIGHECPTQVLESEMLGLAAPASTSQAA